MIRNGETYQSVSASAPVEGKRMEDLMQVLHNLRKTLYQLTDDISEVMAEISELEAEELKEKE